jgi:nucleotide-binding universal stress UspA family protein
LSFALARISLPQKTEEHNSTKDQKFGHISIRFPSFERILVAYDGTEMSKRALGYAAYISKISDSEIVIVNIVEANRDSNNVLPVTINANLEGKEEQIDIAGNQRGVLLDEPLREVVNEMTTACKAAGVTRKITYEMRRGNPADEIINLSNLTQFDLIVMGSRRIASMIGGIGSTTRKVVTTIKTPLLIVQKQRTYKDEY